MSKKQNIFVRSLHELKSTRCIAVTALLIAINITLGITTADCMAFGDYLNDIELLRTAGESYAMANAHEQLAALAKYRCPSNDEDGVCRTIRAVFDL